MAKGKYQEWVTPDGLIKIQGWARDGLTDKQIAYNMGISEQTLNVWKKKYPSLFESLKSGKEVIDRHVENALLKRALGYTYDEVTKENIFDEEEGRYALKVTKVVTKEIHPDTTAQIFWLKNRKPPEWRDKREVEHSGGMNNTNVELTSEERKRRIAELKAKLND